MRSVSCVRQLFNGFLAVAIFYRLMQSRAADFQIKFVAAESYLERFSGCEHRVRLSVQRHHPQQNAVLLGGGGQHASVLLRPAQLTNAAQ